VKSLIWARDAFSFEIFFYLKLTVNFPRTKLQNWIINTDVKLEYDIDIILNCTYLEM